jgi:hypothetical protein
MPNLSYFCYIFATICLSLFRLFIFLAAKFWFYVFACGVSLRVLISVTVVAISCTPLSEQSNNVHRQISGYTKSEFFIFHTVLRFER